MIVQSGRLGSYVGVGAMTAEGVVATTVTGTVAAGRVGGGLKIGPVARQAVRTRRMSDRAVRAGVFSISNLRGCYPILPEVQAIANLR
jgi:hypothetical protein